MILRRYGDRVQSVRPNFDSLAITEIGFQRDHQFVLSADEFNVRYEPIEEHALTAEADGDVQREVEEAVLAELEAKLKALNATLGTGELLLIENVPEQDPARTQGRQTTKVVGTENRYHFHYIIEPPLRVGMYRRRPPPPPA